VDLKSTLSCRSLTSACKISSRAAHCRDRRQWRASGNGRSPSGSEAARYRGHFGAYIGSLWAARGSEEGPSVRHPALHVLTGRSWSEIKIVDVRCLSSAHEL